MPSGISKAQMPSIPVRSRSRGPWRGSTVTFSRRATQTHAISSDRPIMRPGKMPARNSLPIETLATTPKMMKPIDGGITGAITPPAAMSPDARGTAHHRNQQRADRRRVGGGTARDGGHHHRGKHGNQPESAANVPYPGERKTDDALGDAAGVHQLAGQHEKWNGQQREAVGTFEQLLRQDRGVELPLCRHQRQRAHQQRERDRHAKRHGTEQRERENRDRHGRSPGTGSSSVSRTWTSSSSRISPRAIRHRSCSAIRPMPPPTTYPRPKIQLIGSPVTGAAVVALIECWRHVPSTSRTQQSRISNWLAARHMSLPRRGRRLTTLSMPRCVRSRAATTAPMNVSQTKQNRASSSDTTMPELKK